MTNNFSRLKVLSAFLGFPLLLTNASAEPSLVSDPFRAQATQRLAREFETPTSELIEFLEDVSFARASEKRGIFIDAPREQSLESCLSLFTDFNFYRKALLACLGKHYQRWDYRTLSFIEHELWKRNYQRKKPLFAGSLKLLHFLKAKVAGRLAERFGAEDIFYFADRQAYATGSSDAKAPYQLGDFDFALLKTGDILLETGIGSKTLLNTKGFETTSYYTHSMTYFLDDAGKGYFIEAQPANGLQILSVEDFKKNLKNKYAYQILRFLPNEVWMTTAKRENFLKLFQKQLHSRVGSPYNASLNPVEGPKAGKFTCAEAVFESLSAALEEFQGPELKKFGGAKKVLLATGNSRLHSSLRKFGDDLNFSVDYAVAPDDLMELSSFYSVGEWIRLSQSFPQNVSAGIAEYFKNALIENADFQAAATSRQGAQNPEIGFAAKRDSREEAGDELVTNASKFLGQIDPLVLNLLKPYLAEYGVGVENGTLTLDTEIAMTNFFTRLEENVIKELKLKNKTHVLDILPADIERAMLKQEETNFLLANILNSPLFAKKLKIYFLQNAL